MLRLATTNTGTPLAKIPPELRRASQQALRGLAFDVRDALREGMLDAFDRPKPFTLNAFRISVGNGEAVVWAMPQQAKYLFWEIEGGQRKSKAFEHRMQLFGGRVAIPTQGAVRDQYGNMPLSFIKRVLADKNTSGKAGRFFVGEPKGQPGQEGVWARVDNNKRLVRVMDFAEKAEYEGRFRMSEIADQTINARWEYQLLRAIRKA
jgi:hypothetical protein